MRIHKIKEIFVKSIADYHKLNSVNSPILNPYLSDSIEYLLYQKNWIDTVQWHLEDIIRDPEISPLEALKIKRRIDLSNQNRTDIVEIIDNYFLQKFQNVKNKVNATLNTETPSWALDRLSILELKIYHMQEESTRKNASDKHKSECNHKLKILNEQNSDLCTAIEQLFNELKKGTKYMKLYKQMKMYNDPTLNPVLYGNK
jgi:hypothetical protein